MSSVCRFRRGSMCGVWLGVSSVGDRGSKIRYPQLDVLSDGAAHGAEHLVHLVQDRFGGIVAEVLEAGANLCDLVLVAWALRILLPWGSGTVPKSAEG